MFTNTVRLKRTLSEIENAEYLSQAEHVCSDWKVIIQTGLPTSTLGI